ncbi:MAG: arsenate reductase ArsC [Thermoleophilia bacterium]|jgi:protein-tyrosine-phosphatase|nr:arsenate reductase ArsC [Thermoleophilia bacterium]
MSLADLTPEGQLARAVAELETQFRGVFGRETIDRFARETFDQLALTFTVKDFLPLFAYRFTRERLQALAQAEGLLAKDRPEVLFVCVHNAGRSQMAAALTQSLSGGRVHVRSAGSTPADEINAQVAQAMAELGVDLGQEFPKPLTDEVVRAADVVVTMGCGDACPLYPGRRYLDWEVADPAGQDLETVRAIREDIRGRVTTLLAELGVGT